MRVTLMCSSNSGIIHLCCLYWTRINASVFLITIRKMYRCYRVIIIISYIIINSLCFTLFISFTLQYLKKTARDQYYMLKCRTIAAGAWMQQIFWGVLCQQSAARRRCGLSSRLCRNALHPQQQSTHSNLMPETSGPDKLWERGVSSRPVCVPAEWSFRASMPNAADCLGENQTKWYWFRGPCHLPAWE